MPTMFESTPPGSKQVQQRLCHRHHESECWTPVQTALGGSNESWDKNHLFRSTKAPKQRQRAETGCSLSILEAAAQIYHTVHIQVLSRWSCPLPGSVNGPKQHQLNHPFSSVVVWNQEVKKGWENYGSPERQTSGPTLVQIVAIVQQDKCSTFLHLFSHRWEKWLWRNLFFSSSPD